MDSVCRACGAKDLDLVLSLGRMPLANGLLTSDQLCQDERLYPLDLVFCSQCALVQITEVVPPEDLFGEYAYFSSYSSTMLAHAQSLARRMLMDRSLGPSSLAVEIASNDGYLLQNYVEAGVPVLGVEPARNVAEVARRRGVATLTEFFGSSLADELVARGQQADVLHANNVLAHVPDLNGVVAGIARVLAPGGVAVIETPYVRELVERLEFDTIYHEHLYYYSLTSLDRVFRRNGLRVVHVERIEIHGGSLRVFAQTEEAEASEAVTSLLAEERALGMGEVGYFQGFAERVARLCEDLRGLLIGLKTSGRTIAAYGAAAKGAVLLNVCGLGLETIDFVADRSEYKQGRYMPGVHIPVVAPDRLLAELPDAVLLLAWNFAEEILGQQAEYRARGGRFIVPIPDPRTV